MRTCMISCASAAVLALSPAGCASKDAVALRTERSNVTAYDSRDLTRAAEVGVMQPGLTEDQVFAYEPPRPSVPPPAPLPAQTMPQDAQLLIAVWPEASRSAAQAMLEKYGQPVSVTLDALMWEHNRPWAMTIVHRAPGSASAAAAQHEVLEQSIRYRVPADRIHDLSEYDATLVVDATSGLLSARGNTEAMNILSLNLAHDIVTGRKSAAEARQAHHDAVQALVRGEQPAITQDLQFEVSPAAPAGTTPR